MKKGNHDIRDVVYIHLHEKERFVLSYGIEFYEFYHFLAQSISSILLLKHQFDDGELHTHTMFDYVPEQKLAKLAKEDVYGYGDFAWIDFEETEALDVLHGQTIAELLFLAHKRDHLKAPFYQHLNNQFVYLAHDDGWFNKTYYKNLPMFYSFFGEVISQKLNRLKADKTLFGVKKKRIFTPLSQQGVLLLKEMMKEGMVLSIQKASQNRLRIEIPIWIIGDFANMDDMYEEYEKRSKQGNVDGKLVYDKRTKEWEVIIN
ncbi:hypothetical protein CEQ21_11665 [Niallia circulans]|uniref:Uncharacterized protein n=1 Tax=Niallia circulans TaxID=1397 RepID=A0A553SGV6_NIACI|nr:hypothetical protein [Niallia circulans]TRZ36224.1 hypothetical protein CEQ21_11665 [Niallia circulans]